MKQAYFTIVEYISSWYREPRPLSKALNAITMMDSTGNSSSIYMR